jgi:hypothetical protein
MAYTPVIHVGLARCRQHVQPAGRCWLCAAASAAAAGADISGMTRRAGQPNCNCSAGCHREADVHRAGVVLLLCCALRVQQPSLHKLCRAVRASDSIGAQLHLRGLPCGPLLREGVPAGSLEAAQARVCSAERSCCYCCWWRRGRGQRTAGSRASTAGQQQQLRCLECMGLHWGVVVQVRPDKAWLLHSGINCVG